jgi:hypothetical protein
MNLGKSLLLKDEKGLTCLGAEFLGAGCGENVNPFSHHASLRNASGFFKVVADVEHYRSGVYGKDQG